MVTDIYYYPQEDNESISGYKLPSILINGQRWRSGQ
jgi:hypothetical protein